MPQPRPVKEECQIQTRREAWKREWIKYASTQTRKNGSQDHHQLTGDEITGRASLLKRIAEGELHISQSDKGKKIVVMSEDTYHNMAVKHVENDMEVTWKDLDQSQREIRAHSRALA